MFVDLLSVKATERSLFLSKREEADGRFIRPMVEERTNYMTYALKKKGFSFFFFYVHLSYDCECKEGKKCMSIAGTRVETAEILKLDWRKSSLHGVNWI